jgi:Flp pilus assembly protein TadG
MACDRGAVIVQAAITMVILFGISVFAVDYGVLWLSRDQAQLSADAGALAGAIAHAYDGTGAVTDSAAAMVSQNLVWSQVPGVEVFTGACPADAIGSGCVRVNVYRDGTLGSARIPMIFGPVLGLETQGVRATATAQIAVGNSTSCLRPLAIPDRWVEHRPVDKSWAPGDVFRKYREFGPGTRGAIVSPADEYTPPSGRGSGTGLRLAWDLGEAVTLDFSDPWDNEPIRPGMLLPLNLAGGYQDNIEECNGQHVNVNDFIQLDSFADEDDTTDGLWELVGDDPVATWDDATDRIVNSCAPSCAPVSPRLIAIAIFNVDEYQRMRSTGAWCPSGRCVNVVNIVGFFVEIVTSSGAVGHLTKYPGLVSTGPSLVPASSFLPAVTLVR